MYLIWYTGVRRAQRGGIAENPAGLLPYECWQRAGARLAERIGGGRAPCDRERSVAGPVALAGGHASLPSDGKRSVGSANRPARKSHGARIDLPLPGPPRGPARLYQENASHAGSRFSAGAR